MNTSLKVFQVKVTNTGAMCPLMNEGMKPWCKYSEVLTWWVWRSLRTDIRTKLPKGSAVAIHFITDFWAWLPCYTCPLSSEQSCACKLPGSTTVYSFFLHKCLSLTWPKFPSAWKTSCTFSELPPTSASPHCGPSEALLGYLYDCLFLWNSGS